MTMVSFLNEKTVDKIREEWERQWKENKIQGTFSRFFAPLYALVTGKQEYILLAAVIGLGGLVCLFVYVGIVAYSGAKKREKVLRQTIEKYGKEVILRIDIGENISYNFNNTEKTVTYHEIEKIIELDTYLILQLKNGLNLPIWKLGFTRGNWEDFIPFFKQKTGKK